MGRSALGIAALFSLTAGAALAVRPPMQGDADRCAIRAQNLGRGVALQGRVRLQLLVRNTGKVYAAFVQAEHGIEDRSLEHCLVNQALLWDVAPSQLDYAWPYPISYAPGGSVADEAFAQTSHQAAASSFLPDFNQPPGAEPTNLVAAQATLDILEKASAAEQGVAELAVKRYPAAISFFRSALSANPTDPMALRGLAQALAESDGDLKEAAALAQRLIEQKPESEAGHEALLRVCLAAHDDACAFEQFKLANGAKDLSLRWITLRDELLPRAQEAAERLKRRAQAQAEAKGEPQQAPKDPCAQEQGDDKQALCVVKRCLDEGTIAYARELSEQNHTEYQLGEWRTKPVAPGKLLVTRPIGPKEGKGSGAHDAIWLVKLGDQLVMQPSSPEARQITLTHNRCAARASR